MAPVIDENTSRAVYLPQGSWIDYWTGKALDGGQVVLADAPLGVLPLYARAGAIVPKIPEDVMTLVPARESGNTTVHSLDDRRVYELMPGAEAAAITDFEGRKVTRSAGSLTIEGSPAKVTVRWRFGQANNVRVNGQTVNVNWDADGPSASFDHTGTTTVTWEH